MVQSSSHPHFVMRTDHAWRAAATTRPVEGGRHRRSLPGSPLRRPDGSGRRPRARPDPGAEVAAMPRTTPDARQAGPVARARRWLRREASVVEAGVVITLGLVSLAGSYALL